MAEFDEGVSMEEAGIDGAEYEVDDSGEIGEEIPFEADEADTAEEVDEGEDNPWSWVDEKGVTPDVVRDSFENFTKKTQALSAKEAELAPYVELMEELNADAALQQVIRDYYASGQTPDKEIANLSQELRTMQTQIALDAEFKELRDYVNAEGLPAFDDEEVLAYAVEEGLPSMAAAYKAMTYDDARKSARASLEKDIKKGKGAAVPKSGRGDSAGVTRPTIDDVAGMSEEDFTDPAKYSSLVKGIVGG